MKMTIGVETRQEHKNDISPWEAGLLLTVGVGMVRFAELTDPSLSLRDKLPEPIDVIDHIGNPAAMATFGLTFAHVYSIHREEKPVTEQDHKKHNRMLAVAVGVGTIAANAYGELVGYGSASTPDPVDFAYGLLAGLAIYKVGKMNFKSEKEVDEQLAECAVSVEELEASSGSDTSADAYFERMKMLSRARARMNKFMRYKKAIDKHKSKSQKFSRSAT